MEDNGSWYGSNGKQWEPVGEAMKHRRSWWPVVGELVGNNKNWLEK